MPARSDATGSRSVVVRAWFRSLRSIKVRPAGLAYRGFGKGRTARASLWWLDRKHGFEMPDRLRIELFDGLSEEIVRELFAVAQMRPVGSEVILFREGSPARAVHVLASGFVRIAQTTASGARVILRYVKPGEAFGTPALLAGGAYPADAVTVAPCTEMQWPAQTVRDLLAQQPCAALNAIRECEGCLRDMERRIRELSNEPVEQRIAHALVRLTRSLGRRVGNLVEVPFPLSRQDIADMTGTTLHTVSRTLAAWEQQGLVERGRRRVAVADVAGLAALAEAPGGSEATPRRTHRRRPTPR
jgi:CRP-like cAMP-binding protein